MSSVGKDENAGSGPVRHGFHLDEVALAHWMNDNVEGFSGLIAVEQFKGGQSNPTYKLKTANQAYVLRRKPPGKLIKGAHAIEREARVQIALGATDFPVARIHGLCEDSDVLGSAFYVMDMIEGRIFWDATFPNVPLGQRPAYFNAMNATLARLHNYDYEAIGLSDFGKPGNYFARQIDRWARQYTDDGDAGRLPEMDSVIEWLLANIPDDRETSIVHGDFRCDNMIFHQTEPRVLAVLDWELSTLGHPLADFAYHAIMYQIPPHIVAGLADTDLAALNIPSEDEYVETYCHHSGRNSIPNWDYYIAFNFFRLAAIFHGIKGRVIRGTASSAHARQRAKSFPILAALAAQAMDRAK